MKKYRRNKPIFQFCCLFVCFVKHFKNYFGTFWGLCVCVCVSLLLFLWIFVNFCLFVVFCGDCLFVCLGVFWWVFFYLFFLICGLFFFETYCTYNIFMAISAAVCTLPISMMFITRLYTPVSMTGLFPF